MAWLNYLIIGVVNGAFFALMALGLQVIYASSRTLNFAMGNFVLGGSFLMYVFTADLHIPVIPALVAALLCGAVAGAGVERLTIRPLSRGSNVSPLTPTLSTVATSAALTGLYLIMFGTNPVRLPNLVSNGQITLATTQVSSEELLMVALAIVAVVVLQWFLHHTWLGRSITATAQNREGAVVVGVRTANVPTLAFAVGTMLAVLAGVLIGSVNGAQAELGLTTYMEYAFVAAVLGGLASPVSAAGGGLVLGIVLAEADGFFGGNYESVWLFIILALALYIRPFGVFGARRVVQ